LYSWSKTINPNERLSAYAFIDKINNLPNYQNPLNRFIGNPVRAVWDGEGTPTKTGYVAATPDINKVYLDTTTNKLYSYNGTTYVEVNQYSSLEASNGGTDLSLVTTGEKYDWNNKENALDITKFSGTSLTAQIGKYYRSTSSTNTLSITLPTMNSSATKVEGFIIRLNMGSTPAITFTSAGSQTIKYLDGYKIEASKLYEINCIWNGVAWMISYGYFK